MELHTVDRIEELPESVPDATFVVVDVITASTSIITLFEAGARYVRPFADVERARAFGREHPDAVLVGEDGGKPLEGFDHVPLPTRLRQADLAGRPVGIRTTNGTRAVDRLDQGEVLVGSTVNAAAVADRLRERGGECWLVGAGTSGTLAPEDVAGVELIAAHCRGGATDTDQRRLRSEIDESAPATWLRGLELGREIEHVLEFDSSTVVPRLEDGVLVG
jgi:2-phosphosulfolactate phosphatase